MAKYIEIRWLWKPHNKKEILELLLGTHFPGSLSTGNEDFYSVAGERSGLGFKNSDNVLEKNVYIYKEMGNKILKAS
ncbi:hypothetical protein J6590_060592 [Homalodisca vitripennis]|nr:hypothetical protein J6590_060592 [Homalodisca vitripennis]